MTCPLCLLQVLNERYYENKIHEYDGRKRPTCATRFIYDKYKWRFFTTEKEFLPTVGSLSARVESPNPSAEATSPSSASKPRKAASAPAPSKGPEDEWEPFAGAALNRANSTPAPVSDAFGLENLSIETQSFGAPNNAFGNNINRIGQGSTGMGVNMGGGFGNDGFGAFTSAPASRPISDPFGDFMSASTSNSSSTGSASIAPNNASIDLFFGDKLLDY
jgi:hypothetical protein